MPLNLAAGAKRLVSRCLNGVGLAVPIRSALHRRRNKPLDAGDLARARNNATSHQYLMDIHPCSRWHSAAFVARFGGFSPPNESREIITGSFEYDRTREDQIVLLLRQIETQRIPGAFAELGVHLGSSARLIHHYAPSRSFYLFDTFEGFTPDDLTRESVDFGFNKQQDFTDTSVAIALKRIAAVNQNVIPVPGWFPQSIPAELRAETFAFVHLDADLEEPIRAGLEFFAPRLSPGGFILVHDYNAWPGARIAVENFVSTELGWSLIPLVDKSGSVVLTRVGKNCPL